MLRMESLLRLLTPFVSRYSGNNTFTLWSYPMISVIDTLYK